MTRKNSQLWILVLLLVLVGLNSHARDTSLQEVPISVSALTGDSLAQNGISNVDELMDNLPSITNNYTGTNTTASVSTESLRGLGTDRTLVLLNGRRQPLSTVGSMSTANIESVEILTDGAAAIYGSEAISGVINIRTGSNQSFNSGQTPNPADDALSFVSQFSVSTQRMDWCNATQGGQFPLYGQFTDLDMGVAANWNNDGNPTYFFGSMSSGFPSPTPQLQQQYTQFLQNQSSESSGSGFVDLFAQQSSRAADGTLTEVPVPKLGIDLRFSDQNYVSSPFDLTRDTESGASEAAPRTFTNDEGVASYEVDDFVKAFLTWGGGSTESSGAAPAAGTSATPMPIYDGISVNLGLRNVFDEPLTQDQLDYAARVSEEGTAQADADWDMSLSYNPGGSWRIGAKFKHEQVDSIYQKFKDRAAYGTAFRAPSITELYGDLGPSFEARAGRGLTIGPNFYQDFTFNESNNYDLNFFNSVSGQLGWSNNSCGNTAVSAEVLGYVAAVTSPIKSVKDQWAFKRVGAPTGNTTQLKPIVVALIDTGIDWNHLDFSPENLWRNTDEIPGNFKDDDNNGFVDDEFGWDFIAHSNRPWDHDGHGTFVAGVIAATHGNKVGIDGVNPNAKLMILKALNSFGRTRAITLARAIVYAADNGANVINLSVSPGFPDVVQDAVDYAGSKGVLVISAAGNTAENLDAMQPGGLQRVMTVAATDGDDKRAIFSNVGSNISVAAPGVDVVSLRARRTDFMYNNAETKYTPGDAFIGDDNRYYRSAGTSFATAITSAVASYVWSQRPTLSHVELQQILEQSARDVETPGRDRATGYGIVDAKAALTTDPAFFIHAAIPGVRRIDRDGLAMLQVIGTADADDFTNARLEIGAGESPDTWTPVTGELLQPVKLGELGKIPADQLAGEKTWTIRVIVSHQNGKQREGRYIVDLT